MKNGVIEIEKSKRQLAGAVLFALSAVLMVAGEVASFLWLRSLSVNDYFSTGLSNLLQNMPSTLIRLLVPVLFFAACLYVYKPKPQKNAVTLICIASVVEIIMFIISLAQSTMIKTGFENEMTFAQNYSMTFSDLAVIAAYVLLLMTVYRVIKIKIPVLLFSIALSILGLFALIASVMDSSAYSSGFDVYFNFGEGFVFWAGMCFLISTFPKRKPKKETTVSAEIIEPAADMLAVQPETAPVQPDADA